MEASAPSARPGLMGHDRPSHDYGGAGGACPSSLLANLDRRSVRRDAIKLIDLFVGDRDATGRPIFLTMRCPNPVLSVRQSVNHDVESGINSALGRARNVLRGRIGNVESEMIVALRIAIIDRVNTHRGFVIAFLLLRPNWVAPQCNVISLKHLATAQDRQFPFRFSDENPIDRRPGRQHLPALMREKEDCSRADYQENSEENFCAHRKDVRTTATNCTKWNGFDLP